MLGKVLLFTYLVASILGVFHYNTTGSYENLTILPFIYLFLCVILLSSSIINFKENRVKRINIPNINIINIFVAFIIVLSIIDFIMFYDSYIKGLLLLTSESGSEFADIYKERILANREKESLNYTNVLHVIIGSLYNLMPFLFLFYLTLERRSKLLLYGLGFMLLLPILSTISNAGRNGLIVFMMLFLSSYILLRRFYDKETRRKIKIITTVLFSSIIIVLFSITISRFSSRDGANSTLNSMISYGGQSIVNFNEYIFSAKSKEFGDNSFPLVRMLLGLDYSTSPLVRQAKWEYEMGIPLHIFYTYIGDFCLDFGPLISFILILILHYAFKKAIRNNSNTIPIHKLLMVYFIFNFNFQGVFYFMDKTIGGNLKILTFIILYSLLKFKYKKNAKNNCILSTTISSHKGE